MGHYRVIAASIFIFFIFSCQDEKTTYGNTVVTVPRNEATIIGQTTTDISDIRGITKYYPIDQQSYSYYLTLFKYDKESEIYSRMYIDENVECTASQTCESYTFAIASYTPDIGCNGEECTTGNVCFIEHDSETLLFSARWDEGVTPPNLMPESCTIMDGGGNTYFDCAVQPKGTEHELVMSDAFIQFSIDEQSTFEACFN